jgi:hypothetical protein
VTDLNKTGTFAATTDDNFNTIPYYRAKSFRVTNFTGKVVGIRQRHQSVLVDGFNDRDFSEWTGDIEYLEEELEGTSSAVVDGTAHRTLTNQVVLDGSEVVLRVRTPSANEYSCKISVLDEIARLGMDGAGQIELTHLNTKSNTIYDVTIGLYPSSSEYVIYIEEPGQDRVELYAGAGNFGASQLLDSVLAIETNERLMIDPIIYNQKVNHSVEHIGHGGSYTYPCDNNTSEYEIVNLGSDALNYSDNTQTISISGFYAR